ncbi:ABC transporter permease [Candidatus Dependentiae bacterium]
MVNKIASNDTMLSRAKSYLYLFWLLIRTELVILRQVFLGQLVNILFWSGSIVVVSAYILPKLGMTDKFGEFIVISCIAANSFWGIWDSSYKIIEDIETKKVIDYKLTLPLPSWMVMLHYAVGHSVVKFLPSLIVLPVFKLVLGSRMDLSHFSFFKFAAMFMTISLFTGFFFLLVSSFIRHSYKIENVGIRLLFPLWFFGATQYSWSVMNAVNSTVARIILLNPLVYAMEGIHAAVSGQQGYLSFWFCMGVLWVWIIVCGFIAVKRFKKRLDFV